MIVCCSYSDLQTISKELMNLSCTIEEPSESFKSDCLETAELIKKVKQYLETKSQHLILEINKIEESHEELVQQKNAIEERMYQLNASGVDDESQREKLYEMYNKVCELIEFTDRKCEKLARSVEKMGTQYNQLMQYFNSIDGALNFGNQLCAKCGNIKNDFDMLARKTDELVNALERIS